MVQINSMQIMYQATLQLPRLCQSISRPDIYFLLGLYDLGYSKVTITGFAFNDSFTTQPCILFNCLSYQL